MALTLVSKKAIDDNLKICEDIKKENEAYYNEHWKSLHEALLKIKANEFPDKEEQKIKGQS